MTVNHHPILKEERQKVSLLKKKKKKKHRTEKSGSAQFDSALEKQEEAGLEEEVNVFVQKEHEEAWNAPASRRRGHRSLSSEG